MDNFLIDGLERFWDKWCISWNIGQPFSDVLLSMLFDVGRGVRLFVSCTLPISCGIARPIIRRNRLPSHGSIIIINSKRSCKPSFQGLESRFEGSSVCTKLD
jgi:hypothetical protein